MSYMLLRRNSENSNCRGDMMDDRKRLVEMISNAYVYHTLYTSEGDTVDKIPRKIISSDIEAAILADILLDNGVQIPTCCKDCKHRDPEDNYCYYYDYEGVLLNDWCAHGHGERKDNAAD